MSTSNAATAPHHNIGRWFSIAEAADHYRVSTYTIRRRIADGTLTAKRFGPRLLRVWIEGGGAA